MPHTQTHTQTAADLRHKTPTATTKCVCARLLISRTYTIDRSIVVAAALLFVCSRFARFVCFHKSTSCGVWGSKWLYGAVRRARFVKHGRRGKNMRWRQPLVAYIWRHFSVTARAWCIPNTSIGIYWISGDTLHFGICEGRWTIKKNF